MVMAMESMTYWNMRHNDDEMTANEYPRFAQKDFKSLGTDISVMIVTQDKDEYMRAIGDLETLPDFYTKYMHTFSRFDTESELSRLNRTLGVWQRCSPEMCQVVQRSLEYCKKTGGMYDPRILSRMKAIGYVHDFHSGTFESQSSQADENYVKPLGEDLHVEANEVKFDVGMDFSGIVKGYITDRVRESLLEKGWKDFLVDSGGDMYMAGSELSDQPWRIAIEGIPERSLMFSLSEKAIATSGISRRKWEVDGKRYHHLIHPQKIDTFDFSLKSVTVIADTTEEADVWAKVLFLKGIDEGMRYAEKHGMAALFLPYLGGARVSLECKRYVWKHA